VLAPRREMAWSNSIAYGANATGAVVRMHPDAVPATGTVDLSSPHGRATATVAADANVRAGVVSMTHGHAAANPGDLTSGHESVDELTAMPRVSGLEVTVELRPRTTPG